MIILGQADHFFSPALNWRREGIPCSRTHLLYLWSILRPRPDHKNSPIRSCWCCPRRL